MSLIKTNRKFLLYGLSLAALLFLLKWLEYRFVLVSHAMEVYITAIALLFTALGIWLALKLSKPKVITQTETVVKEVIRFQAAEGFVFNEAAFRELGLSQRELEVLQGIASGLSNQEIADQLFVSLNTIKTHASRLFEKLDVKRRTQAVEKGKQLGLIG